MGVHAWVWVHGRGCMGVANSPADDAFVCATPLSSNVSWAMRRTRALLPVPREREAQPQDRPLVKQAPQSKHTTTARQASSQRPFALAGTHAHLCVERPTRQSLNAGQSPSFSVLLLLTPSQTATPPPAPAFVVGGVRPLSLTSSAAGPNQRATLGCFNCSHVDVLCAVWGVCDNQPHCSWCASRGHAASLPASSAASLFPVLCCVGHVHSRVRELRRCYLRLRPSHSTGCSRVLLPVVRPSELWRSLINDSSASLLQWWRLHSDCVCHSICCSC